jgi:hypothetical protein
MDQVKGEKRGVRGEASTTSPLTPLFSPLY